MGIISEQAFTPHASPLTPNGLLQFRHVAGESFSERVEVPVVLQVPSHVTYGPWDVLKIAIVALLPGDIDEPAGCLQVALDAGQVEESLERHAVERRARPGPSLQVADDQFVDQVLVERQIGDRKSTRLNSSHLVISYAVFCLKKKKKSNDNVRISSTHL